MIDADLQRVGEVIVEESEEYLQESANSYPNPLVSCPGNDIRCERRRAELMLLKVRIEKSQKLLKEAFDPFCKQGQLGLLDWYKNTKI